ncbi:MAG TPA: hypothetical protein VK646_04155, partial [Actinomycetota bacterium]|nr:hypothetical protein [Actinomycetota bacterium]
MKKEIPIPFGASARRGSGPSMAQSGYPTQPSGPVATTDAMSPNGPNRYRPPVMRSGTGSGVAEVAGPTVADPEVIEEL